MPLSLTHHVPLTTAYTEARRKEVKLLEGELSSVQEISFAFRRCSSRLIEMSSRPKTFQSRQVKEKEA